MSSSVVGLYLSPLDEPLAQREGRAAQAIGMYRWAVHFKANPRPLEYMASLLSEHWPDADLIDVQDAGWRARIAGARTVVLLYPDAIGLGFGHFERDLLRAIPADAEVQVLNGRRRRFVLDARTQRSLRLRRFLERSMVVELAATPVLVLGGIALAGYDRVRGRR